MNNRINRCLAHGTGIIINVYTYRIIYNWKKNIVMKQLRRKRESEGLVWDKFDNLGRNTQSHKFA
jgi:hypothetical protein